MNPIIEGRISQKIYNDSSKGSKLSKENSITVICQRKPRLKEREREKLEIRKSFLRQEDLLYIINERISLS